MARPRAHGDAGVGDGAARIIVHVSADRSLHAGDHGPGDIRDFVREAAAVRVAQHKAVRSTLLSGQKGPHRVLCVGLVPVEEVLCVIDNLAALRLQIPHRALDDPQVVIKGNTEDVLDVKGPALAEDGDGGRLCVEDEPQRGVILRSPPWAHGAAERHDLRVFQAQAANLVEEADILRVGVVGQPTLDVGDAEVVEALGDAELVPNAERDPFRLVTISQGRVEDVDLSHRALSLLRLR